MRIALAAVALVVAVGPGWAASPCMVTDPTGTPLNVRSMPNGPIIGALHNGTTVGRMETVLDGRGRPWTYIIPVGAGRAGWIFREFVSCY